MGQWKGNQRQFSLFNLSMHAGGRFWFKHLVIFYQMGKVWVSFYVHVIWRSIVKMLPSLYSVHAQLPLMTVSRHLGLLVQKYQIAQINSCYLGFEKTSLKPCKIRISLLILMTLSGFFMTLAFFSSEGYFTLRLVHQWNP